MIPARYQDVNYDTDVPDQIKTYLREMRKTSKGIYIHGNVGSGKTHIAFAIYKKYQSVENRTPMFWNTAELLQAIKDDFDAHYLSKTHTLENVMETERLLILDDIGSEKPTEWVQERFYSLINKRYNEMRPTIFTSNLSTGELSAQLGQRIASRIIEMCHVVKIEGKDRRLEKKGTSS